MIDLYVVAFCAIALVMILSAIMVLRAREVVHSALFLALTFVMVGCTYILLNAEYIALIQIMVYAGAITVLLLFAIMLTKRKIIEIHPEKKKKPEKLFELVMGVVLFVLMVMSILIPLGYSEVYHAMFEKPLGMPGSTGDLSNLLVTTYLITFLIIGVLLAVSILAGVVMAREKEEE